MLMWLCPSQMMRDQGEEDALVSDIYVYQASQLSSETQIQSHYRKKNSPSFTTKFVFSQIIESLTIVQVSG